MELCKFSETEVMFGIDTSIPVECPECGAIRTVPKRSVFPDMFIYPPHTEPESMRLRRRYQRVDGNWRIVE